MEGLNIGAILLVYLAALMLGVASLVAFGLLIARQTRAALISFSSGLLCMALIVSLAILSFLQKGQGFGTEGS